MSKPDELIAELCPNGVEHKTLDLGQVSYGNTDHLAQNERKDCAIIDDELRAIKNLFSELERGDVIYYVFYIV